MSVKPSPLLRKGFLFFLLAGALFFSWVFTQSSSEKTPTGATLSPLSQRTEQDLRLIRLPEGLRAVERQGTPRVKEKRPSIIDRYYHNAPVLSQETLRRPSGDTERVSIVETGLKYPIVRVVDTLREDPETGETVVLNSIAMAANHVIAEIPEGVDLTESLKGTGYHIEKEFSYSTNVLIRFPAEAEHRDFLASLAEISARLGEEVTVEPDFLVYSTTTPDDPSFENGSQWALNNFGQSGGTAGADISTTDAWEIRNDARSVIVGVVDTGLRTTHTDLVDNLWVNPGEIAGNGVDDDGNGVVDDVHGFNAIQNNGDPTDQDGHGTHVSGIIGAQGNNDRGVTGVAWEVQIMGLRFLGAEGGFTSDAIEAIDYGRIAGAQILNNSWAGGGFSTALVSAIQRAENADILFIAAAGNESSNNDQSPVFPASYTLNSVISVGSSTRNDTISSFSNTGATSVDLFAPGSSILSTFNTSDSALATLSGTSMASPQVAGAAAILRAEFPNENVSQIRARLLETVDVLPALSGNSVTSGRLNLLGALLNEVLPNPGFFSFNVPDVTVTETADEVAVTVTRNIGTAGAVTLTYATINETATAGQDYQSTTGTLFWADGDSTERIINIPITDDVLSEGVETFAIRLSSSTEVNLGGDVVVSILDNEATVLDGFEFANTLTEENLDFALGPPAPFIDTAPDGSTGWVNPVIEGGRIQLEIRRYNAAGALTWRRLLNPADSPIGAFQARLAMGPAGEVIIAYASIVSLTETNTLSEVDTAVAVYNSSGILLFNEVLAGDSPTLDLVEAVGVGHDGAIYVGGDYDLNGANETFLARVSPSSGDLLWIRTEDFNPTQTATNGIGSIGVSPNGDVFAGGFTNSPNTGFIGALVSYSPTGTRRFMETFPAVEQQRIISSTVNDFNEVYLGLRTFDNFTGIFNARLLRVSPESGTIIWQRAESVGDDIPNFLIDTDPNGRVYFVEGAEFLGSDSTWFVGLYDREGTKVLENPLDASTPLSISSIASNPDGSLLIAGAYNGQAQFGSSFPNSGGDDDAFLTRLESTVERSAGILLFESETYSTLEDTETLDITILREGGTDGDVTVNLLAIAGEAQAGEDFLPLSQTIIFSPGQLSETLSLTITNDFRPEPTETLSLLLSAPTGGATLGALDQATVIILNDDLGYEEWLSGFFTEAELEDPAIFLDTADPDGDGLNNLTEYAFGTSPVEASTLVPPMVMPQEDTIELNYQRSDGNDLSFQIWGTTDLEVPLEDWDLLPTLSEVSTPLTEGLETTTVILPRVTDRHFYQVRATRATLGIGSE